MLYYLIQLFQINAVWQLKAATLNLNSHFPDTYIADP